MRLTPAISWTAESDLEERLPFIHVVPAMPCRAAQPSHTCAQAKKAHVLPRTPCATSGIIRTFPTHQIKVEPPQPHSRKVHTTNTKQSSLRHRPCRATSVSFTHSTRENIITDSMFASELRPRPLPGHRPPARLRRQQHRHLRHQLPYERASQQSHSLLHRACRALQWLLQLLRHQRH